MEAPDMNDDLKLSEIGQIAVTVPDLERAVEFYRDVLGMRFLFQVPPGMAFFQCGSVRLLLGLPQGDGSDHPTHILYYKVDDIRTAHEALEERGVEIVQGPFVAHKAEDHELWLAFFRDAAGHTLALMSEVDVR
jgi:methylmalonyl-CoA/ethylmalonyl-CoA epimerase